MLPSTLSMALEPRPPSHPDLEALTHQYQPVLALDPRSRPWHEALVRWSLPDGTIRGPLDILPYWLVPARRPSFTRFTLLRAAHALQLEPTAAVSVNLSPDQLLDPSALDTLRSLQPSVQRRLIVELTEQPIPNPTAYGRALAAVREQCALVLLDDVTDEDLDLRFRYGASVDGVKIDRSMLPGLLGGAQRERAARLLEGARERFDVVVAEGVEDAAVCDELARAGVTHVQGFGVGTPAAVLTAHELPARPYRPEATGGAPRATEPDEPPR